MNEETKWQYSGLENKISAEHLKNGEICRLVGIGNSMTPILKSRQPVLVEPITNETELSKKDIVFCKVKGHYYLHLIHGIKSNDTYLIGNNHGHMNGWISRSNIFGKVIEIL